MTHDELLKIFDEAGKELLEKGIVESLQKDYFNAAMPNGVPASQREVNQATVELLINCNKVFLFSVLSKIFVKD